MKIINLFIFIFCFVYINSTETNYYYEFNKYIKLYSPYIYIEEIDDLYVEGYIDYTTINNDICYRIDGIYIKKNKPFKLKFQTLIHELTHYLQCIYSYKKNKNIYVITNNIPSSKNISFIKKVYNESHWTQEYEAFFYQYNTNLFNNLENNVLYNT